MDKARVQEALYHQRNFMGGFFTDGDVLVLKDYWESVMNLTSGIESLRATTIFAAVEHQALENIAASRGIQPKGQ